MAVSYFLYKYKIHPKDMLVIADEYNFPVGKVHLKKVKSDGGHNGVASILRMIKSNEFYLLRCGIDQNFGMNELSDYVLSPFKTDEIQERDAMISRAVAGIKIFLNEEPAKAMSIINSSDF